MKTIRTLVLTLLIMTCLCLGTLRTHAITQKDPRSCGIEIDLFSSPSDSTQPDAKDSDQPKDSESSHDSTPQGPTLLVERKRIIGKIDYLPRWSINPESTINLLLKAESVLNINILDVNSPQKMELSQIQKISLIRQLGEFKTSLESTTPLRIEKPVLSGDYPSFDGKKDVYGKFKSVNEDIEQTADFYPLLYMTGFDDFSMPAENERILKSYLLRGGILFADPAGGEKGFSQGFLKLVKKMFPQNELQILPDNHPVYEIKYRLDKIRYTGSNKHIDSQKRILGMTIGCKTAIFFSPDTVGCAWDGHMHGETIENEMHYDDALGLGINLIAYALSHRDLTLALPDKVMPDTITQVMNPDLIEWQQITYSGNYDPNPASIVYLQDWLAKKINIPLTQGRRFVSLKNPLPQYPFVTLMGKNSFKLDESESQNVLQYIEQGGKLLVFSACGEQKFNEAFREWTRKKWPSTPMLPLPSNHPIFSSHFLINTWQFREQAMKSYQAYVKTHIPSSKQAAWMTHKFPVVEYLGMPKNGGGIYFFPFDLTCAWKKEPCLLCAGISERSLDSFNIMANLFIYFLFPIH